MANKNFNPQHIADALNNVQNFIDDNTISDRNALLKALCIPKSAKDIFKVEPLKPIGCAEFVGDKMPEPWSLNSSFDKGTIYPIYNHEYDFPTGGDFPIGKDGIGKKFHENNWRNLIFF